LVYQFRYKSIFNWPQALVLVRKARSSAYNASVTDVITKTGGLNLIALYLKGWRPSLCTGKYEEMANMIFQRGLLYRVPILSGLLALWNRGLYSAEKLETAIQQTYGNSAKMLDPSYAASIGTRVLLPTARCPEPSILLFTNYNGEGPRVKESGTLQIL
jgi:hypothetical protein